MYLVREWAGGGRPHVCLQGVTAPSERAASAEREGCALTCWPSDRWRKCECLLARESLAGPGAWIEGLLILRKQCHQGWGCPSQWEPGGGGGVQRMPPALHVHLDPAWRWSCIMNRGQWCQESPCSHIPLVRPHGRVSEGPSKGLGDLKIRLWFLGALPTSRHWWATVNSNHGEKPLRPLLRLLLQSPSGPVKDFPNQWTEGLF